MREVRTRMNLTRREKRWCFGFTFAFLTPLSDPVDWLKFNSQGKGFTKEE
jgi:hypothetical protein